MAALIQFSEDFGAFPMDVKWKGARQHIGPVEAVTPFIDRLSGKTTCATLTLMAGVMCWGAHRLQHHVDQSWNLELAEATFAFQLDWRYVDIEKGPALREPDQPAALSASLALNRYLRTAMEDEDKWNSYFQPIMLLSHMAHIVHHILPEPWKEPFYVWLFETVEILDRVAPKPKTEYKKFSEFESEAAYDAYCAPHRGSALSPDVFPPTPGQKSSVKFGDVSDFVRRLSPLENRYLRNEQEMAELDFVGHPYIIK